MSALSDAFTAIKNVMLLQERVEGVKRDVERLNGDVRGLNDYVLAVDKRVVRIETMIEMTDRQAKQPPRIEG
jgi:hypothetical protein